MNKIILFLLFFPLSSFAQDIYSDILAEGKTWNLCRMDNGNMHVEGIRGDTIIDGHQCKRYGYVGLDGSFYGYVSLYKDGEKIYYRYDRANEFSLLFDMGLSEGDTLSLNEDGHMVKIQVDKVGYVLVRGHQLKYIEFKIIEEFGQEVDNPYTDVWIEGIGGTNGPFTHFGYGWAGISYTLHEITCKGEILYDSSIFFLEGYERMFLNYRPEWSYQKMIWNGESGEWERIEDCYAWKSGTDVPQPKMFEYRVITTKEGLNESTLLLREIKGKVLAQKESYMEFIQQTCPHISEVYEYLYDWREDVVLYDFTLEMGDRYPCKGEVYVSGVSHMTTRDSVERKVLFLSNGLEIVEGIGCLNSPDGPFAYQNSSGCDPIRVVGIELGNLDLPTASLLSLRKYGENTAPIYVKGDEIADIKRTSMTNTINGSLHDLQGRRVTGTPQRGIYIRNGKKIVIK